MLAATSWLLPLAAKFIRQIVPPVIATLVAAVVIAGFNRTFSSHLQQPRMAAIHGGDEANAATPTKSPAPVAKPASSVTETITIYEEADAVERIADKDAIQESGKDQTAKLASLEPAPAPAPQPTRVTVQKPEPKAEPKQEAKVEPKAEPRIEQRHVAAVDPAPAMPRGAVTSAPIASVVGAAPPSVTPSPTVAPNVAAIAPAQERAPQPSYQQHASPQPQPYQQYPQPQVQAPYVQQPYAQQGAYQQPPQYQQSPYQPPQYPAPYAQQPVAQQPPSVVMAQPPIVTVPDRQRPQPRENVDQVQAEPQRPNGAMGTFVNAMKPSTWLARMREFGDRIEQAGNDILPNIRQQ